VGVYICIRIGICYLYNCTIHHMLHSTYLCVHTVAVT